VNKRWEHVNLLLDRGVKEGAFPAAVLFVCRNDRVVFREAAGYSMIIPERKGITLNTCFDIASLTKIVATTSAIMLLVQQNMLNIDDPVCKFFPGFKNGAMKRITIRHLLSHSAGLAAWKPYYKRIDEEERDSGVKLLWTPAVKEIFLRLLSEEKLVYTPGKGTRYSDLGFILLGFIIERITAEHLDEFCRKNIFNPLKMRATFFVKLRRENKKYKAGFAATENCPWRGRVLAGEVHDENAWALGGVAGHAGLFSTGHDLARFATEIINACSERGSIFKSKTASEFFKKQNINRNSTWALGWDTPTKGVSTSGKYFSAESIGHTGFTGTSLWIDLTRKIAVVLLTNRIHPDRNNAILKSFRPEIHDRVMEALGYAE